VFVIKVIIYLKGFIMVSLRLLVLLFCFITASTQATPAEFIEAVKAVFTTAVDRDRFNFRGADSFDSLPGLLADCTRPNVIVISARLLSAVEGAAVGGSLRHFEEARVILPSLCTGNHNAIVFLLDGNTVQNMELAFMHRELTSRDKSENSPSFYLCEQKSFRQFALAISPQSAASAGGGSGARGVRKRGRREESDGAGEGAPAPQMRRHESSSPNPAHSIGGSPVALSGGASAGAMASATVPSYAVAGAGSVGVSPFHEEFYANLLERNGQFSGIEDLVKRAAEHIKNNASLGEFVRELEHINPRGTEEVKSVFEVPDFSERSLNRMKDLLFINNRETLFLNLLVRCFDFKGLSDHLAIDGNYKKTPLFCVFLFSEAERAEYLTKYPRKDFPTIFFIKCYSVDGLSVDDVFSADQECFLSAFKHICNRFFIALIDRYSAQKVAVDSMVAASSDEQMNLIIQALLLLSVPPRG
jgi:hypothetical protein